ncbi:MAG: aminopeptidase, partial [Planctomycetaceae bacterium]|nr:aminopeptidase [Planctomycetaceae bacterium]
MTDDLIACWADLLVDYCLRVAPGETILISSEWEARPLVEACYRSIVLREAHPLVRLDLPGLYEFFLRNATEAQLAHAPPVALFEAETAHARIRIAAESDTRALRTIDPARQAAVDRARDPIRKAASRSRWVVTQYPTRAYARDAGMELPDYEAFVASAMFLDRPDPVAAWQELGRRQAGLV